MSKITRQTLVLLILGLAASGPAPAYIGPGSGISLLSGLWGILVAIVLAVGAVLFWPIRYLFRRIRRKLGGGEPSVSKETSTLADSDASGSSSASPD